MVLLLFWKNRNLKKVWQKKKRKQPNQARLQPNRQIGPAAAHQASPASSPLLFLADVRDLPVSSIPNCRGSSPDARRPPSSIRTHASANGSTTVRILNPSLFSTKAPTSPLPIAPRLLIIRRRSPPRSPPSTTISGEESAPRASSPTPPLLLHPLGSFWQGLAPFPLPDRRVRGRLRPAVATRHSDEELLTNPCTRTTPSSPPRPPQRPATRGNESPFPRPIVSPERPCRPVAAVSDSPEQLRQPPQ